MEKTEHIHVRATELDKARLVSLDLKLPGITQTDIVRASLNKLFRESEGMTAGELYNVVSEALVNASSRVGPSVVQPRE